MDAEELRGGARRRRSKTQGSSSAKRASDAKVEAAKRAKETTDETLQRRIREGADKKTASRKKKSGLDIEKRKSIERARKSKSLSVISRRRVTTADAQKRVRAKKTTRDVRKSLLAKKRADSLKGVKKSVVRKKRDLTSEAQTLAVRAKEADRSGKAASAAKLRAKSSQIERAAKARKARQQRVDIIKARGKKRGSEETRTAANDDITRANSATIRAVKPSVIKPTIRDPVKPNRMADAGVNSAHKRSSDIQGRVKDLNTKADAARAKKHIPSDPPPSKSTTDATSTRDNAKNTLDDAAAKKKGLEAAKAEKQAQLERERNKTKVPATDDPIILKRRADEQAAAKRKRDDDMEVAAKKKSDDDMEAARAAAAKKKHDDEVKKHSKDRDLVRETMASRGARFLAGALFLAAFPFPFPGSYGRRGRRPPLQYSTSSTPKTPGGLPVDLFSSVKPQDAYSAGILDGKQDGYSAGYADGKEGGAGIAVNNVIPPRDPVDILQNVLDAKMSMGLKTEREAFCAIKLTEAHAKGQDYVEAYPQCIINDPASYRLSGPIVTVPLASGPLASGPLVSGPLTGGSMQIGSGDPLPSTASGDPLLSTPSGDLTDGTGKLKSQPSSGNNPLDSPGEPVLNYVSGYKSQFVAQYHAGYTAGFAKGRQDVIGAISGPPAISGAPSTTGGEGPKGSIILEQLGGAYNPRPDILNQYESDSDEENFIQQDEFLYLLRRGGINKKSIENIRKMILTH